MTNATTRRTGNSSQRGAQPSTDFDLPAPAFTPVAQGTKPPAAEVGSEAAKPPQYTQDELLMVFDTILFEGVYEEAFLIRGKLEVVFQTRSAKQTSEIQSSIDKSKFELLSTMEQARGFKTVVASLVSYNGKDLRGMSFAEKEEMIGDLPSVMIGALIGKLQIFDEKVSAALQEGDRNF
jgi:hypothetical protein